MVDLVDLLRALRRGTYFRVRSVKDQHEERQQVPGLREDARCVRQDCPVHCEMDSWKKPATATPRCGGYQKYTRDIRSSRTTGRQVPIAGEAGAVQHQAVRCTAS